MSGFIMVTGKDDNKKRIFRTRDIYGALEQEDNTTKITIEYENISLDQLNVDYTTIEVIEPIGTIFFMLERDEE